MKYIARITDCGPLSFRDGRETTRASSLGYVPGSALLGGLASLHALLKSDVAQFNRFFMNAGSNFGNLYPDNFETNTLKDVTTPVYPLPATARSCKRFSGFQLDRRDEDDELPHGVFDTLIPWALFALSGQTTSRPLQNVKVCPVCQESLDHLGGFYRRNRFDAQNMGKVNAKLELRTRTSINRATGTVRQGILYSREALKGETTFWGTLTVPDESAEAFEAFVEQTRVQRMLHIGNNRTRGFGRVTLSLDKWEEHETTSNLHDRIQAFDHALRQQAQEFHIATPHKIYIPFTLISDMVLPDHLLRYQTTLTPNYLATTWNIPAAEAIYQNSSIRQVMGWNDLLRLPKPDEIAIKMGSVFLFGLSSSLNDDLLQTLLRMQEAGIGSRRREGFGRLLVASPFHWEVKGQ